MTVFSAYMHVVNFPMVATWQPRHHASDVSQNVSHWPPSVFRSNSNWK